MKRVGGKNINENIKQVTKTLFRDTILCKITWFGTSSKQALRKKKRITALILKAVGHSYPNVTLQTVRAFYGVYLKNAKPRTALSKYIYY